MWGHLVVLLAQGVELLLPGHGVPPGVGPTLRQVLDMKILEVSQDMTVRLQFPIFPLRIWGLRVSCLFSADCHIATVPRVKHSRRSSD